jgi:hypothetical protein
MASTPRRRIGEASGSRKTTAWDQNSLIFLFEQYDIDSYWGRIDEQKSVLAKRRAMGAD